MGGPVIRGTGKKGYAAIANSAGVTYLMKDTDKPIGVNMAMHTLAAAGYEQAVRLTPDMARIGPGGYALVKAAHLARCMAQSGGNYLEIGTQFGFSAICVAAFVPGHIYCIDPMEKVKDMDQTTYGNLRDGFRGHVGEVSIFKRNMKHFGLTRKVTLIQESSDPWPISEQVEIGTAYIDGDHSYEMVKKDFFNVMGQVTHYILVDDYLNEDGVTKAVPEIIAEQDEFRCVLLQTKMAIFARIGADVDEDVGIL